MPSLKKLLPNKKRRSSSSENSSPVAGNGGVFIGSGGATHLSSSLRFSKNHLIAFALVFGLVGIYVLAQSFAATNSTISGVVFKDINRNGVMDSGEEPMVSKEVILIDADSQNYVTSVGTDNAGRYSFSGLSNGNYKVEYSPVDWGSIREDWVPTTTGSVFPQKTIDLTTLATVDFGWRQIIHSDDINAPISSYDGPNGLKVRSFNDAISAQEVYGFLSQGSLIGRETPAITVNFGYRQAPGSCTVSVSGSPGYYTNYKASVYAPYVSFLDNEDHVLFHEYGHAWSLYYAYIIQQNTDFTEYLKLRGIENDPRLDTNHAWNRRELIAEDYKQLFGSPGAQLVTQENLELPPAKDVPGLKEYLSGAFMQPVSSTPDTTAPSVPAGLSGSAVSDNEVKLSWTASTDNVAVDKYYVFRDGQQVGYVNSPSTTFADTGLTPGSSYQYYVKAVDAAGNQSAQSNTVTVKSQSPDTQAPSTPSGLTSPSQTSSSISLKWNASSDNVGVVGYKVYKIGGNRKNSYVNLLATASSTSFSVTGLSKGTSYSFYVVAIDAAGNESSPSNMLTVKTARR